MNVEPIISRDGFAGDCARCRTRRRVTGAKETVSMAKNETGDVHLVVAAGGIVIYYAGDRLPGHLY